MSSVTLAEASRAEMEHWGLHIRGPSTNRR